MRRLENVEVMAAVRTAALVFGSGKVGQTPPYGSLGFDRGLVRDALEKRLTGDASSNARPYAANRNAGFISDLLRGPIAFADAVSGCGAQ